MGEGDHAFDSTAAAAFIMETQLAATRRATKMHHWVQMIIWGTALGGLGVVILAAGSAAASCWFVCALAAATTAAGIAAIVASRGFGGALADEHRLIDVAFLVSMAALTVAVALLPGTAQLGGIPLVWLAVLVASTLVAGWVAAHGILWKEKTPAVFASIVLLVAAIVFVLLLLFGTDQPAALFIAVIGIGWVVAAFPVRSLELRRWHADPVA